MLLSEHIVNLQKVLEEKGDQDLYSWVDNADGTVFLVRVPEIQVEEISGSEYQVPKELRNKNGNILVITNMDTDSFDEDDDSIQDLNLVVEKELNEEDYNEIVNSLKEKKGNNAE